MSRTKTVESDEGSLSNDQIGSPLVDKGKSGGTSDGGVVLKKGPWTSAEDAILVDYVKKHGEGNWNAVQKHSGLSRCGKSCRLRWANHLRPNLKKGTFSAEEERLIVELHAKMGNKWARMAAQLPGRTDNEIKNYWNTRIKRRQRAGLPLYPAELCMRASQEGQQGSRFHGINNGNQGFLQSGSRQSPDVMFDSLKANQGVLSYVSELADVSGSSLLMKSLGPTQFGSLMPSTLHRPKRLREPVSLYAGFSGNSKDVFSSLHPYEDDNREKLGRSFGYSFPIDLDPTEKDPLPSFDVVQGGHSFSNGNSSTSKPTPEALKMELPSLQYSETDFGSSWDTSPSPPTLLESVDRFIQSPPRSGKIEAECHSPRNNGLLETLVYEAKTLSSAKNQSSDKSSNSSAPTPGDICSSSLDVCKTEWDEYGDPISPLGHSATSLFNEHTPMSASGSSLDDQPHADTFPVSNVKKESFNHLQGPEREQEIPIQWDYSRPDALLASSDWFGLQSGPFKEQAPISDSIATLLGDDLTSDYKQTAEAYGSSDQGWGFGSYAWNNMPAVCQMSEFP
ncbi:transcription factor GAMYB-like [Punica granatum]|uniref:Uncharacterized protein n=2 Tax=Punica granatum TaxID=22663 RepID=A0A218X0I5_PUNGR|nr:transcription factor GAMYB-like [Punica granatum]XP_031377076.1 transcription factor GAMYB-like [Punica granatum]XP_031377077.1 transcription factor GAMYB-like [Punica granatum]XP_031377078.1 transcription factor GAMYB-like [Punica granatum]OWM78507.1 hypothetical protein CDL15_Pgr016231 [Punica granatum]PKI68787.1 hypothetical protein CRG98_010844 [Punica granatum]